MKLIDQEQSITSKSFQIVGKKVSQGRRAANARERARMRILSKAFSRLKTSLPWVPSDTKLSKLDTLRLASSYINHLARTLEQDSLQRNLQVQSETSSMNWSYNEDLAAKHETDFDLERNYRWTSSSSPTAADFAYPSSCSLQTVASSSSSLNFLETFLIELNSLPSFSNNYQAISSSDQLSSSDKPSTNFVLM